ncbi:ABC transporter permease [uncultured Helcococcus sp.]|uniref:ABC transporter permease n=1 Tax=uncultured Helcococcus sp. TaxID=1072508 RepID=UPI00288AA309|nr:ABC transporter permease [uncultured Helcococcus sp.]
MFGHVFKNTFKVLLRQRALVFWSLFFPIILGLLFKLAFGNLNEQLKLDPINVLVNEELYEDENIKSFFDSVEKEKIFKIEKVTDEKNPKLDEHTAYIRKVDDVLVKDEGFKSSIVTSVMNAFIQNSETIYKILEKNPNANINELIGINDYIKDESNKNMNLVNTYFYTLIGMQSLYGYMWGMVVIYQYEANLSTVAKRNVMSPSNIKTKLLSALLVAWIINTVVLLITILVLKYLLKIDFGDNYSGLMVLILLSALCGVSFGTLIATGVKADVNKKEGMGIGLTMLMSFMAGMMVSDIKMIIQRNIPILNKINPVAIITDALYSMYYYNDMARFYQNISYLGLATFVFIVLTAVFTKGKRYEHL